MNKFFYVYILQSIHSPTRHYIGFTKDLEDRLKHHNRGAVPSTTPHRPWVLRTYVAFSDQKQALEFENYLKSHSGRAFASKRL